MPYVTTLYQWYIAPIADTRDTYIPTLIGVGPIIFPGEVQSVKLLAKAEYYILLYTGVLLPLAIQREEILPYLMLVADPSLLICTTFPTKRRPRHSALWVQMNLTLTHDTDREEGPSSREVAS